MRAYFIFRRAAFAALSGLAMLTAQAVLPDRVGISAAQAQPAELGDFHLALEPYGMWQLDRRWGEVWVPFDRSRGWRPYSIGHWVYTDEWGWYWISEQDEEDWGWITYHYGRWARNAQLGWFWIPGNEWAPAWVNWRDSDEAIGWAPMPPDDEIDIYDDNPIYWTFIAPRYLFLPAPYRHYYPVDRRPFFMRRTIIVNRSLSAGAGRRFGVNPGVAPGRIAAVNRAAVPTFRVQPRVLAGTQGVAGAVQIQRNQLGGARPATGSQRGQRRPSGVNAVAVQPTNAAVAPAANVQPLQPLGKGERGRLGSQPPRAVQGGAAPAAAPKAPAVSPSAAPAVVPNAPSAAPVVAPKPPAVSPPAAPAVAPPSSSPPANAPPPRQELRRNPPQPGAGNPPPPTQPVAPAPQIKQAAPPAVQTRPPPPVAHPPPPAVARPAPPPVAHPAPPAVARPAPPPPVARPAAPPPRPAAPPPPAVKKPPLKPGEKPPEPPK
jgi:Family of unknown function (DUF6600)